MTDMADMYIQRANNILTALEPEEVHNFPPMFFENVCTDVKGIEHKHIRFLVKALLAAVLAGLLLTSAVAGPSGVRVGNVEITRAMNDSFAMWNVTTYGSTERREKTPVKMNVSWLPEGYVVTEQELSESGARVYVTAKNDVNDSIYIEAARISTASPCVDLEEKVLVEEVMVQGEEALLTVEHLYTAVSWLDSDEIVFVYIEATALSVEEVLQIAENITVIR